jgi:cell division cycle 2-like protein
MTGKSRWGNEEEDAAARKKEKEEKKRAKAEKQRRLEEEAEARRRAQEAAAQASNRDHEDSNRPTKRRKLSNEGVQEPAPELPRKLLRFPAPEWSPCRHIDNFERLNHIEEGSYGWVSRARETGTGEIVALKKLKMDHLNDGFPVTALREIQTLKESRHRHIVDLREVVMGDSLTDVFLVMEFLEHDLKTLQEDMSEPFLPSEIKTLMLQITSAVDYLHDHWILHRDLKTSNILMNNRGEIKLADFGMARYFGDPPPANMTQLVVTLWYRAPELLLGADKYDQSVDLWSVGCIFGELFKKEPILQGKNEVDELSKVVLHMRVANCIC